MSNNHPPTIPKLRKILQAAAEGCSALDSGGNTTAQQREELQSILTAFLSTPCISKLTALPSQLPPHHKDEISEIKSSLNALSKSVNTLLQKASNRSNKPPSPPTAARAGESTSPTAPSYAKAAATRSPRASLVMDLKGTPLDDDDIRPRPAHLTEIFNEALRSSPHHQVRIAATRWTANRNLVITGGHMTTAQQLRNSTDTLALALAEDQIWSKDDPSPLPIARPNVKWSKILINGTPTGVLPDRAHAYSAEECHEAFASENPIYASLLVTQKPNWVRPPSQYTAGSSSSLVVAFEDPDGSLAKSLLAEKHLYAFGARATVKRWKQRPPKSKNPPSAPTASPPPPPSPTELEVPEPIAPTPPAQLFWSDGTPVSPILLSTATLRPTPVCSPDLATETLPQSPQKRKAPSLSSLNASTSSQTQQPPKRLAFTPRSPQESGEVTPKASRANPRKTQRQRHSQQTPTSGAGRRTPAHVNSRQTSHARAFS
ncbi:hypothetical protein BC826DRAFT_1123774 [Russula brevipes]|nr:hypothetical protein BC826DRAFT_1123774 [Russula brevipes]